MIAAGPDGIVAAIYEGPMDLTTLPDQSFTIEVVCSTDGGATFAAPISLGLEASAIELPGGVQPNGGPSIAVSPCGRGRTLYAAFTIHRVGSDHSDIAVSASFDGGSAWSAPTPITPADHVIYFQPQLAIDESGRVFLSAFALNGGRVDVVLFDSPAGRPRFGPPRTVTSTSFDPALASGGGKHGAWWIGDYQGLVATRGRAHPFWNDTRTGRLDLFTATVTPSV
jgi:hypothetical protein